MKLDPKGLRYMSAEEFRVLTAIEVGSRNHDVVPESLVADLSRLHGGINKFISDLIRRKLIVSEKSTKYTGYRLVYSGYDHLALKTLSKRGNVVSVGNQIGVGKESDIFVVGREDGSEAVLKLHRLGRQSFRNVKQKRDYFRPNQSPSWMYMSRLSAMKEYAFMKVLHEHGFPVPTPYDHNRHCVVMEMIEAFPLRQVDHVEDPGRLYSDLMDMIVRLAKHGLIHGDFNEFNILLRADGSPVLIDFPQMVSTSHANAELYFDRDVSCIRTFFKRRFGYESMLYPKFALNCDKEFDLDVKVAASGFSRKDQSRLERMMEEHQPNSGNDEEAYSSSEEEEEEEEEEESANSDNEKPDYDSAGSSSSDYIIEQDRLGNTIRRT
ncbi:Serine/threonine-protein kinase rio2 [Coemansia sp. RSA 989]|nr:serine/threonine protein kinase [Coemansia mojavensis]KAJ1750278.1 Serine/threonine-protein kinase rio2 [Coemansia sp. RSA 1821]KAJ1867879.1 Serine/threonine-protein kinase rio2 [Coemansia sp. RSA 989]KAJ1871279.1 Serine/threonine-protein kinase rio2 [Coemansia sp. RSA 990]KAJ2633134.1 Serine/threonine-protein kinase rio2 [Coemansia sp. RSA 1290]KAJ2653142.1 Serine/threonine-protein kinase rio2 [Coemansia sp. RSA 1250]KAJ2676142.1 Serine/threonine-protein kinase rio2 [Coemansia sp. RSA 108